MHRLSPLTDIFQTSRNCYTSLNANYFLFQRLFVIQGKPELELPRLFKAWKITRLTFEFDHEPDGRQRDSKICELASEAGIEVETRVCHSLYDLDK